MNKIIQAAHFAQHAHRHQKRKYSGDPYIFHPMRVAARTTMLYYATEDMVCAAYLHDVVEDCGVTFNQLYNIFGGNVAFYVNDLTCPPKDPVQNFNREQRKRNERERLKNISRECRAIKLIDRIDNVRDIPWDDSFAKVYFQETELLLEALKNTDDELENELKELIERYKTFTRTLENF